MEQWKVGFAMVFGHVQGLVEISSLGAESGSIFDIHQFNSSTMGDRALQSEIIELFLAQLDSLNKKLVTDDLLHSEIKYLSHTIRGAALSIGANEIARLAERWDDLVYDTSEFHAGLNQAEFRFRAAVDAFFLNS